MRVTAHVTQAMFSAMALVLAFPRCSRLDAPDVADSWRSPDGRYVAEVRNHLSIDPPYQVLWIGRPGGPMRRVQTVAADTERSNGPVLWSSDSKRAVYVDAGVSIVVVDPESGGSRRRSILPRDGSQELRGLRLAEDGTQASFQVCRPRTVECTSARTIPLL